MMTAIRYRPEIDGLRAIAVVAVILNHFQATLAPSGHLGVDIFFVISGYVISLSLCGRDHRNLRQLLLGFYARRLKRLMPALIVCTMVSSVLLGLVDPAPAEALRTGIAGLFGLANMDLWQQHSNYFGTSLQLNSFMHLWSLGVEEQFYLVFPFLLWGLLKRPGARFVTFYRVMIAASLASLGLFAMLDGSRPMACFYFMPLRFWELAVGCIIAVRHFERGRGVQPVWRPLETIAMVLLVAAMFAPPSSAALGNLAVVGLTGSALALLAPGSLAYRCMTNRIVTYLGLISYSLYLWHWPVLVLGRFTIGVSWTTAPILAGLTLLAASLSYHWVEKPIRGASWARNDGRAALLGSIALVAAAAFVVILAGPLAGRLYTGTPPKLIARGTSSLSDRYRIPGTAFGWAGAPCVLQSDQEVGKHLSLGPCTLGHFDQAPRRVIVFGNSLSAAIVAGFDSLVRDDGYAVTLSSSWASSPVPEMPNDSPWAQASGYYWATVYPSMVSQLRPGDWFFLVNNVYRLVPAQPEAMATRELGQYETGLRRISADLARRGVRLAVLDVGPLINESICQPDMGVPQWFAPGGGPCTFPSKAVTIARRRPVHAMLLRLEREGLLAVVDPLEPLCPRATCTFIGARKEVLYRDAFHPSIEGARAAAPVFRSVLTRAYAALPAIAQR